MSHNITFQGKEADPDPKRGKPEDVITPMQKMKVLPVLILCQILFYNIISAKPGSEQMKQQEIYETLFHHVLSHLNPRNPREGLESHLHLTFLLNVLSLIILSQNIL